MSQMPASNQTMMNPPQKSIALNDDAVRFQVELEFVQCLANPNYLNFLAQRGYFKVILFPSLFLMHLLPENS